MRWRTSVIWILKQDHARHIFHRIITTLSLANVKSLFMVDVEEMLTASQHWKPVKGCVGKQVTQDSTAAYHVHHNYNICSSHFWSHIQVTWRAAVIWSLQQDHAGHIFGAIITTLSLANVESLFMVDVEEMLTASEHWKPVKGHVGKSFEESEHNNWSMRVYRTD